MKVTHSIILKNVTSIDKNDNGTWAVHFEGQERSQEDFAAIERMFPHLSTEAWKLLSKELLLASVATEAEIMASAKPAVQPEISSDWPKKPTKKY